MAYINSEVSQKIENGIHDIANKNIYTYSNWGESEERIKKP